ncbi:DUF6037 family protein [Bacillus paranthracis]|nr:DUF6037 family protein [Bacillus cereus]MDG1640153.1 DUF6037 family protein [Bacillus paranthracis]
MGLFKRGTNEFLELPLIYKNEENYKSFHLPLADLNKILYKKLCEFLEIDYNKNGPFKPLYFFKALHNAIPTKANILLKDRLACSYSYPTSKDNEQDKIYFRSFLNNDLNGKKRSLENKANKPLYFFKALHNAIPTKANILLKDRLACSYSYPTSKDNEQDKIYFRSFLNNDLNGKKRSLENKAKTEKLLPDAHKLIGTRNISVCFTRTPKDERKEKEEIKTKFNKL